MVILFIPNPVFSERIFWNLTSEELKEVRRVENYLNQIKTMKSDFTQINPDGSSAHGTLYIQRPGFLRFEYEPPEPYLIVANGMWLIFVDRELQHASHLPLKQTLAWFLIRDPLSLTEGVKITQFNRGFGTIRIKFVETDKPENGSVTLAFSDRPLQLKGWSVTDQQQQDTQIAIDGPEFGLTLDRELFRFVAPPEWTNNIQDR